MDVDDVVEAGGGGGGGGGAEPVGGGGGSAVVDGSGGRGAAESAGAGVTRRAAWVLLPVQRRPLPAARAVVLGEARGFASAAVRKRGSRSPRRRALVRKPSSERWGRGVRIVGRYLSSGLLLRVVMRLPAAIETKNLDLRCNSCMDMR